MTNSKFAPLNTKLIWLPVFLGLVLALGTNGCRRTVGSAPPTQGSACQATKDCDPGTACVAPGVCSRLCKTDRDCTAGSSCAELRVMEPTQAGTAAPQTVTTCVIATPR